jgi:hypothetical protein
MAVGAKPVEILPCDGPSSIDLSKALANPSPDDFFSEIRSEYNRPYLT